MDFADPQTYTDFREQKPYQDPFARESIPLIARGELPQEDFSTAVVTPLFFLLRHPAAFSFY
jgi:hypothetical protein